MEALLDALVPVSIFGIIFGTVTAHRYMRHRETMKMIEHGYTPEMLRAMEHRASVAPSVAPPYPLVPPVPPASLTPPPAYAAQRAPASSSPPPDFAAAMSPGHGAAAPPYPQTRPAPVARGGNRAQLVWGCILAGTGLALSLALWPIGFAVNAGGGVRFPLGIGPWMVAGFIPLFVGLALLLAYTVAQPDRRPRATYLPPQSPSYDPLSHDSRYPAPAPDPRER